MKTHLRHLFLSTLTTTVALSASAKTDWSFKVERPQGYTEDVCVVRGTTSSFGIKYHFELRKVKNSPKSPLESVIFVEKDSTDRMAFIAKQNGVDLNLPFLRTSDSKRFWGVNRVLNAMMAKMSDKYTLDMTAVGLGNKPNYTFQLDFKGFPESVNQMSQQCNSSAPVLNSEFEATFFAGYKTNLDPNKAKQFDPFTAEVTRQIRELYFNAYPVFMDLKENQAKLAQVLAKYKAYQDELDQVNSLLDQLQNRDLPNQQLALEKARKQQIDAKAMIAQLKQQIPLLNEKLQNSIEAYNKANEILSPLMPSYNSQVQAIRNAQSALEGAQENLRLANDQLRSNLNEQTSVRREYEQLNNNRVPLQRRFDEERQFLAGKEASIQAMRTGMNDLRQRRLQMNPEAQRLAPLIKAATEAVAQLAKDVAAASKVRDLKKAELDACTATPGKDCSAAQAALGAAASDLMNKQSAQTTKQGELNELNKQYNAIVEQINQQLNREFNDLVREADGSRTRLEQIRSQMTRENDRMTYIRNEALPRLSSEESRLRSNISTYTQNITDYNTSLNLLNRQLAEWRAQNDFDNKYARYQSTLSQMNSDQQAYDSAVAQKAAAEKSLADGIKDEADRLAQIEFIKKRIEERSVRKAQLEKLLEPLPNERAPFDEKIATLSKQFGEQITQLNTILK